MFMEERMFSRSGKIIPVARNSTVKDKEKALYDYTEPIKGHGGGEKVVVGRKIFVILFCVPPRNFCILAQNQLSSDKHFRFTLQIAVVHKAPCIQNVAFHIILYCTLVRVLRNTVRA